MNTVRQIVSLPGEMIQMRLHSDQKTVTFEKFCELAERCFCRIADAVRSKE